MSAETEPKKWYKSKTILLNILSVVALLIQTETGFVISPAEQLAVVNVFGLLLRAKTHSPITK